MIKITIIITQFGNVFALLQNPAIHLNNLELLSPAKIEFLLDHISDNLSAGFEHLIIALKAIKDGKNSGDDLNSVLKDYYLSYHKGAKLRNTVVSTIRAGILSKLNELGLLKREEGGKYVLYHITNVGQKYIQNTQKAELKEVHKP